MGALALDADVVIAFLDATDAQHGRAIAELRPWLGAGHELLIGASTLSEVLVRPIATGTDHVVEAFLSDAGVDVVAVDRAVARRAAELRARHSALRLPGALALAIALAAGASLLTFDERLHRVAERE